MTAHGGMFCVGTVFIVIATYGLFPAKGTRRAISHPGKSASSVQAAIGRVHRNRAPDEAENQAYEHCDQHHGDNLEHRGQISKEDVSAKNECAAGQTSVLVGGVVVRRVKNWKKTDPATKTFSLAETLGNSSPT